MRESVTQALTEALFEEWARTGYGALSLESVAKRAGVGKAALYRRWSSKLEMVSDCMQQIDEERSGIPAIDDTGSIAGDVKAILADSRRLLRHTLISRIIADLHAEMLRNPELASAVRGRFQARYRTGCNIILQRAIARGEIAARVDMDLATDALVGIIYWHMIGGDSPSGDKYLDRLARFIVAGLTSL